MITYIEIEKMVKSKALLDCIEAQKAFKSNYDYIKSICQESEFEVLKNWYLENSDES